MCFALSITAAPVLAWGGGDCPFSKKESDREEASYEKTEQSGSFAKD